MAEVMEVYSAEFRNALRNLMEVQMDPHLREDGEFEEISNTLGKLKNELNEYVQTHPDAKVVQEYMEAAEKYRMRYALWAYYAGILYGDSHGE